MPIAAVPAYLGRDFKDASPGLRFGMYLTLWGINRRTQDNLWTTFDLDYEIRGQGRDEREVKKENKVSALHAARTLTPRDRQTLEALAQRQQSSFTASGPTARCLRLEALATAPFTTGLGNEHPLENGFAFLNPYGLPYLPGSGVKGVLRQAARELADGEWGDRHGWSKDRNFQLRLNDGNISFSTLDALFGLQSEDPQTQHLRGALTFWDVIPQIKGDSLAVDIMTPHQSHYYQQKPERKAGSSSTPHDSGQPNPISFLTIPPGSGFAFHVQCDLDHLRRIAPGLAADGRWKAMLTAAFEHAFQWLGFGAKTAVGYGSMRIDPDAAARQEAARRKAEEEAQQRAAAAARDAELAQLPPLDRGIREFLDGRPDKNQSELSALIGALKKDHWTGEEKIAVAGKVKALMQTGKKWREKSEKKNPAKDNDHQDTLKVISWLDGK